MRTDEARGLLWLMEEEGLQPGGSEETLLRRLFSYYGPAEGQIKGAQSCNAHLNPKQNAKVSIEFSTKHFLY